MPNLDAQGLMLERLLQHFESVLSLNLPAAEEEPCGLHQAMRYSVLSGGKRIRPLLCYAAGEALGCGQQELDPLAVSLELMHAYSLIHDDLPAMDDDDLRRGRLTCHKAFNEATAILAGDAIQAKAFEILADHKLIAAERRARLIADLAKACGSMGMAGGQAIDLESIGINLDLPALQHMHQLKTGALIECAVTMPCYLSDLRDGQNGRHYLKTYGRKVGLAFQIKDDLLDIEGETVTLGKPQGSDQEAGKPTFPSCVGVDASRKLMDELLEDALAQLEQLPGNTKLLATLASFAIKRDR